MIYQFIPTLENNTITIDISKFGIQSTPGCEFKIGDITYTIGNTGYYESPDGLKIESITVLGISPKSDQNWETFIPKNTIVTYEKYIAESSSSDDDDDTITYNYEPYDYNSSVLGYSDTLDSFILDESSVS